MKTKNIDQKVELLETIEAPTMCKFTVVQLDLEKIARNQQKIYNLLQKVMERNQVLEEKLLYLIQH